ncbi:MAG: nucleoside hydrolase [Erysipelotrichaceae bacterium]|nr:nucleoside hydrolase [Erysipelotrichaceae bacterium]
MNRRRIIMDVDTGSDDAVALMLACKSPELKLEAVTVGWGNRPVEDCVRNTLKVLHLVGRDDIPVYQGCPEAMVRYLNGKFVSSCHVVVDGVEHSIHPASFNIPAPDRGPEPQHAVSFLVEYLMKQSEKITVVSVGPPTNLGMAFRLQPAIKEHIEEVVFMGGSINRGNETPVAEANFCHDPEAAKIIIDSGVRCTLITLNATHSAEVTREDIEKFERLGTPEGRFTAELISIRLDAQVYLGFGDGKSDALHDALAIAYLVDPKVITDMRKLHCDIDIGRGAAYGMVIADQRGNARYEEINSQVSFNASRQKFVNMLLERFAGTDR